MKKLLSAVTILLIVLVLVSSAQKADELRNKYGAPDARQRYVIRPGVGMTVAFARDGLPSEMVIKRLDAEADSTGAPSVVMSSAVVKEIIEEIAPLDRRGKLRKKAGFTSGCTNINIAEYEHVRINIVARCEAQGRAPTRLVCAGSDPPLG